MKNLKNSLAVGACALLGIGGTAFAHDGGSPRECGLGTLEGLYAFNATGFSLIGGTWQPKALVEYIRFNADGTGPAETATIANRAGDGQLTRATPTPLSYTLDASCRGTLQFANGPSFDIFTTARGVELQLIQTNPNNVLQGNVRRVAR